MKALLNKKITNRIFATLLAACCMFQSIPVSVASANETPTQVENVTTGSYEEDGVTYCTVEFDVTPGTDYCDTMPEIMPYSYDDHTYLVIRDIYTTQQIYLSGNYLGYEMTASKNDGTALNDEVCVQLRNNVTSHALMEHTIKANGSTRKIDYVPLDKSASYYYFRFLPLTEERLHVRIVVYSW